MNSMTGFGKAETQIGAWLFSFEARSVNHRFLDVRFRLPASLASLEAKLSETVRAKCNRGSIDINLRQKLAVNSTASTGTAYTVDWSAAESFLDQVTAFNKRLGTHYQPTLDTLVGTGRIFQLSENAASLEALVDPLNALLGEALDNLCKMRAAEGKKIQTALREELDALQQLSSQCRKLADGQTGAIRERMQNRLQLLALQAPLDAQRLELEIALFADKADVSEELQRLDAHLESYLKLVAAKTPSGRKLEFLTQELHREVNTLASKSASLELTQASVDARARIEKLREQIQNVE